ncbi:PAS domain S-box protein [Algoriphagus terrigena]|uniref:PAS domain S-box protein n=1 Tax=Algoriphagus terrigena TaxID=344884 RepID=UPI000414FA63|nr:PAS domain S-box protein [Algoriphagus terrigena]
MSHPNSDQSNQGLNIFDLTPFPMWIYDLESFRFLAVNKEAVRHYGYSEEEFLSMTIKDIRPREDIPKVEEAVRKARNRSELYNEGLFRHQKRDGTIIYSQIRSNLIDYQGRKAGIVSAVDLTERFEREQEIEAQKEYLKAIGDINELLLKSDEWLDSLGACFRIVGETSGIDRIYYFQNDSHQQSTSLKLEWTRGTTGLQIDNPEHQNIPFSDLPLSMERLNNQRHFEVVIEELPPSRAREVLMYQGVKSLVVSPIWVDEDFRGFIGLEDYSRKRKFTERERQLLFSLTTNLGHVIKEHEAHQELLFREARFKSLIQNGKDLIAIIDKNGDYQYVAPTTEAVLGISPGEFLQKNAFEYISKGDVPRVKRKLKEVLTSDYVSIEPYRFADSNGNWRWIRTELSNHLNTPLIRGIVANTHEVTAEVEKRRVDDLAATLSAAIGRPGTLASCLSKALHRLAKLPKIDVAEIWFVSEDSARLNLTSSFCSEEELDFFCQAAREVMDWETVSHFPASVWNENKAVLWKDIAHSEHFHRAAAAKLAKLNTGMVLPINHNHKFLGCLVCFSKNPENELLEEFNLLTKVSEQLGAVIKLKTTEEEYRNFFDITPDPHCVIGFDGSIRKFNKAFSELLGYGKKELLKRPIFKFIHEADQAESREKLLSSIHRDVGESFEARFITKQGHIRWLVWNGSALPESRVIVAVAKDITEEKLAKQELQAAYDRLKTAQKIAKLGYWVRNLDTEVSVWSEETYRIYGYSPEDFSPTMENLAKTFHPDDRHLVEGDPSQHLVPGQVQSFEHRIITGTGVEKWVHQEVRLMTDGHAAPVRIEGTIQDITERKESERQLMISNERFKLAVQVSNELIWEVDHTHNTMFKSAGYSKSLRYESNEHFASDNSWFSKIHPEDRQEVWSSFQRALQDKNETSWKSEYRMCLDDGSLVYFADRCFILRDDRARPVRSIGAALDITSSRQQLERIKSQNDALREIAWMQSHVIRAPLSRIMSLIYLAEELGGGGQSKEEIMKMIRESANDLDGVIRDVTEKIRLIEASK